MKTPRTKPHITVRSDGYYVWHPHDTIFFTGFGYTLDIAWARFVEYTSW